jgi:putative two-component system response regulator
VKERTHELELARLEILERLARAAEFRDDDTGEHTKRVGYVTGLVAAALGLSAEEVELVERAATLHDIGKIGVSDTILLKPGPLTPEEFDVMRKHTIIGAGILSGSNVPVLQTAGDIAISHHERWDGSGYPEGRKGERIPLVGRIVAIADLFDALTHERPYKKAWTRADALAEIQSQSGRQLDPGVVAAFMHVLNRVPERRA